jgi:hypothetical protein
MRPIIAAVLVVVLCVVPGALLAQSFTTGMINLRNASGQAISVSSPSAVVTPYRIDLPSGSGSTGQVLSVTAVAGSTVTTAWSDAAYWGLSGSTITAAGTGPGQSFIGTSNAQDVIVASGGTERLRVIGTAGPAVGRVGIGTSTPASSLDVFGDLTLSSNGAASGLVFVEPSTDGTNSTTIRAASQAGDIVYTLPAVPPTSDGMVLGVTVAGAMSWQQPAATIGRGRYQPVNGSYVHVINTGAYDVRPGDVAVVSVFGQAGTTVASTITAIDADANTITVETSMPITDADRITWVVLPQ